MRVKTFYIHRQAMGKPRSNRFTRNAAIEKYHIFADQVRAEMKIQGVKLCELEDVIQIDWYAKIQMPKSWSKKKKLEMDGQLHRQKPDRDNIDKAIMDSMFYKAESDDCIIACGYIEKKWTKEAPTTEVVLHLDD